MYRRAESVEASYESLVVVLTERSKLELIAYVSRSLNKEIMQLTKSIVNVFHSLENASEPTLQYVAPSYFLLHDNFKLLPGNHR